MVYTCLYGMYRHGMYMFMKVRTYLTIYKHVHAMYRHVHTQFGRFFLVLFMHAIVCTCDEPVKYKHGHLI